MLDRSGGWFSVRLGRVRARRRGFPTAIDRAVLHRV